MAGPESRTLVPKALLPDVSLLRYAHECLTEIEHMLVPSIEDIDPDFYPRRQYRDLVHSRCQ